MTTHPDQSDRDAHGADDDVPAPVWAQMSQFEDVPVVSPGLWRLQWRRQSALMAHYMTRRSNSS